MHTNIRTLAACPLFAGIEREALLLCEKTLECRARRYAKDENIFHEGAPAAYFGIISEGCAEIKKYLPNGRGVSVFHCGRGELIGVCAALPDRGRQQYEITAAEKSTVILVPRAAFHAAAAANSLLSANLLRIFANRILRYGELLELMSFSSIQKKIVYSLLHDFSPDARGRITLPYAKTTWAEHLNVSRPSLSRELQKLCGAGILDVRQRQIAVLRRDALEALLSGE